MSTPVEQHLTRRFLNLYGAPEATDPAAFVAEYGDAMNGTDPSILKEASDLIVRHHRYRNWPTVGECVAAVEKVAAQRARQRELTLKPPPATERPPTREERVRVAGLVNTTVASLKRLEDEPNKLDPDEWKRATKTAWVERMKTSQTARWLSLPQWFREQLTGDKL